jgi:hypothetical protein
MEREDGGNSAKLRENPPRMAEVLYAQNCHGERPDHPDCPQEEQSDVVFHLKFLNCRTRQAGLAMTNR